MSSEQNKTIALRVPEELYNHGNLAVVEEAFAPDYVEHHPLPPGFPSGREAVRVWVAALREAFPDFHYTVDDVIADGDRVAVRLTGHGTLQREFMGIPATGRSATWTETHWCRMADGKIVEHWINFDQLGMLQQLGTIPAHG